MWVDWEARRVDQGTRGVEEGGVEVEVERALFCNPFGSFRSSPVLGHIAGGFLVPKSIYAIRFFPCLILRHI